MFSRSLAVFQQRTGNKAASNVAKQSARLRSVVPLMQVYNVQPDPADGSLTKITAESRGIRFAVFPQLGAPNTDPQDEAPQFDVGRKAISTLPAKEAASFLAVLQGKLPTVTISSEYRKLTFAPANSEAGQRLKAFTLSGTITRGADSAELIPVKVNLEKSTLTSFRYFLESALDEGFGFAQFFNPPQKQVIKKHEQEQRVLKRQEEFEAREAIRRQNGNTTNSNNRNGNNTNNNNRNGGNGNSRNNNNRTGNGNNDNNNNNNNNNNRNNNRNRDRNNRNRDNNESAKKANGSETNDATQSS